MEKHEDSKGDELVMSGFRVPRSVRQKANIAVLMLGTSITAICNQALEEAIRKADVK